MTPFVLIVICFGGVFLDRGALGERIEGTGEQELLMRSSFHAGPSLVKNFVDELCNPYLPEGDKGCHACYNVPKVNKGYREKRLPGGLMHPYDCRVNESKARVSTRNPCFWTLVLESFVKNNGEMVGKSLGFDDLCGEHERIQSAEFKELNASQSTKDEIELLVQAANHANKVLFSIRNFENLAKTIPEISSQLILRWALGNERYKAAMQNIAHINTKSPASVPLQIDGGGIMTWGNVDGLGIFVSGRGRGIAQYWMELEVRGKSAAVWQTFVIERLGEGQFKLWQSLSGRYSVCASPRIGDFNSLGMSTLPPENISAIEQICREEEAKDAFAWRSSLGRKESISGEELLNSLRSVARIGAVAEVGQVRAGAAATTQTGATLLRSNVNALLGVHSFADTCWGNDADSANKTLAERKDESINFFRLRAGYKQEDEDVQLISQMLLGFDLPGKYEHELCSALSKYFDKGNKCGGISLDMVKRTYANTNLGCVFKAFDPEKSQPKQDFEQCFPIHRTPFESIESHLVSAGGEVCRK